jgi:putative ABC transport system permease protein
MASFIRKVLWQVRRRRKEAELREELAFHLAEETAERASTGLTDDQARRAARRDLGNVATVLEETRAAWGWVLLEQFLLDLRYAGRMLARTPAFTVAAVITLALGIGLTTSIFSIVNTVLLRPLPFDEPEGLVIVDTVIEGGRSDGGLSPPNFMSLREDKPDAFAGLAAVLETEVTLTGEGDARRLETATVSGEFFELLRMQPIGGRPFRPLDNESADRVVVVGHGLWREHFGGDWGLIGRPVVLDGVPHTVVGVMPPAFDFPNGRAIWVPLRHGDNYFSATSVAGRRSNAYVRVLGRLRPGVSLDAARAELDIVGRRLSDRFRETNTGVSFTSRSLHAELVGDVRTPLLMLFGAVGLVLLIASTNVAGLLLVRATARRQEIALRAALGAGRARIVRQLLTESLLLAVSGGGLGLLLAFWTTGRIATQFDALRRLGAVGGFAVDGTVLSFAMGVTLLATVLAGILPARRAADSGLSGAMQSGNRTGVEPRGAARLRSALVIAQIAIAVVLLHGAGLLVSSLSRLMSVEPGFHTAGVLAFRLDLPRADYRSADRIRSFFGDLRDGILGQPGVESVGAISRIPIGQPGGFRSRFRPEGSAIDRPEESIAVRIITPGYFDAVRMPVRQGRGITDHDDRGSTPVVVINEAAAARFFPGADPIGRRFQHFSYDPIENAADAFTIVGVVADVRSRGLREAPQPEAYFSHRQVPLSSMVVMVRVTGDPRSYIAGIRREIQQRDRNLPMLAPRALDEIVAASLQRPRILTTLLTLFAAVALTLAGVGLFGLLSFTVARRAREIGIRLALGAAPAAVVRAIAGQTSLLVVSGLMVGLCGAAGFTRALGSELFGIAPRDPWAIALVALVLGATALAAAIVPAWRAASVDPLMALRSE